MIEAKTHCLQVLGKLTFQPTDPPLPFGTYVIQRVPAGTGNVTADPTGSLQIRRHVVGIDPNTLAQQANRWRVKQAVAQWHQLDAETKVVWRKRGHGRNITGFNAYLSAALKGEIYTPPFDPGYTPPAGNAITLNLTSSYTAPAGNAITLNIT